VAVDDITPKRGIDTFGRSGILTREAHGRGHGSMKPPRTNAAWATGTLRRSRLRASAPQHWLLSPDHHHDALANPRPPTSALERITDSSQTSREVRKVPTAVTREPIRFCNFSY